MIRAVRGVLAASLLLACATSAPLTTWPYSSWYDDRGGGGSLGEFKAARQGCLAQLGIADPETVAHDSPTENSFLMCMNAAGWCTNAYRCEKPGAS